MNGFVHNIFRKLRGLNNPPLDEAISDFRVLAWSLTFLLFIVALIPTGNTLGKIPWIDKLLHALGFYFLFLFFIEGYGRGNKWKLFLFIVFLGFFIEIVQGILPWRDADIIDFGVDVIGVFLALITPLKLSSLLFFLVASLLGIGKIPWAPATVASGATLIIYALSPFGNDFLAFLIPVLLLIGIFTAHRIKERKGETDPKEVVIDEVVGMLITVFLHPKTFETLLIGFILFRFFDIAKPSVVGRVEKLPGGIGIMMDDVVAGIFASIGLFFLTLVDKLFPLALF